MADKRLETEEVSIDSSSDQKTQKALIDAEAKSAKRGALVGFAVIVLGAFLTLAGAIGAVDLQMKFMGLSVRATNAAPGVVAMLIGGIIIYVTSLRIKQAKK